MSKGRHTRSNLGRNSNSGLANSVMGYGLPAQLSELYQCPINPDVPAEGHRPKHVGQIRKR